ncbi:MAG: hypothetical protein JKY95_01450 [Planctomycetaceae bacterium]|nr:hypothetical protein [Planctomycetaceae bacterium]
MSTVTTHNTIVAQDLQSGEFNYRPTPVLVPVGLALAIVSSSALLGAVGIVIAIIAVCVSLSSLLVIARSDGMYSGRVMSVVALAISFTFATLGTVSQVHAFNTEVPDGYRRVSFARDISSKGFVFENGQYALHPDVAAMIDQKIFFKGYMYPQRQTKGLRQFLLLKDTGECCFGGQPKATDMILVKVENEKGTNYRTGRVAVAGTLRLTKDKTPEGLQPIYALEAIRCERSKSAF